MIPLEHIINEIVEKLKREIENFFEGEEQSIESAERVLSAEVKSCIAELVGAYYCKLDSELLQDKPARKEAGLSVERRNESREILTEFGTVTYNRTYYSRRGGGYCYPIDAVAGISRYERISQQISKDLCDYAKRHSFSASSEHVTGGHVSRQTVMNKLRITETLAETDRPEKKKVSVLHIDADEDHVSLQDGTNVIAPIISVYEGMEHNGKRRYCKNIQHHTFFECDADEMWENVLSSVEKNYDIENTAFYIHGDGAKWIKVGKEWFPNARFVLDRYHYNKTVKKALACMEPERRGLISIKLRNSLENEDMQAFRSVRKELLELNPQRAKEIKDAMNYLCENMSAVSIYKNDPEASNGGATEPHVSHVLSERLSMRPMGWSRETLRHLVPILGGADYCLTREQLTVPLSLKEKQIKIRSNLKNYFGSVDSDLAISSPVITAGKANALYHALKPFLS